MSRLGSTTRTKTVRGEITESVYWRTMFDSLASAILLEPNIKYMRLFEVKVIFYDFVEIEPDGRVVGLAVTGIRRHVGHPDEWLIEGQVYDLNTRESVPYGDGVLVGFRGSYNSQSQTGELGFQVEY